MHSEYRWGCHDDVLYDIRLAGWDKASAYGSKENGGEIVDKEHTAIERIKLASAMSLKYYQQPLVCTYSGGKDSDVLLELFRRSGVPYEVKNSHTTVDAPPTVYHIRNVIRAEELRGVRASVQYPIYKGKRCSMWSLIQDKGMPPTRIARYCCQILKENSNNNRYIATGVRKSESVKRSRREEFETITSNVKNSTKIKMEVILANDNDESRRITEHCQLKNKMCVNPIIDWTDSDIWDFIRSEKMEYNPMYDMGYFRVGCVGCPMATPRWRRKEFRDFPKYQDNYIRAFEKMLETIWNKGASTTWKTAEDVFNWWMEDDTIPGQMKLDDIENSEEEKYE